MLDPKMLEEPQAAQPQLPVPAAMPVVSAWTAEWKALHQQRTSATAANPVHTSASEAVITGSTGNGTATTMTAEPDGDIETEPLSKPTPQVMVPPVVVNQLIPLAKFLASYDYRSTLQALPRGLVNPQNMCFMNVILQAMVHAPPFLSLLDKCRRSCGLQRRPDLPILNALMLFAQHYIFIPPGRGTPPPALYAEQVYAEVCAQSKFEVKRGRQEDAQEFLGHLLDILETELATSSEAAAEANEAEQATSSSTSRTSEEESSAADGWHQITHKHKPRRVSVREAGAPECALNPVRRLFGGRLSCVLQRKGSQSVTLEPFQQLPLDISSPSVQSVQDAVDRSLAPELLVPGCERRVTFDRLPPILVLCFKRFTFERGGNAGKIVKTLKCGPLLLECGGNTVEYRPSAIVSHHGPAPDRGHYTCCVNSGCWHLIDDDWVETLAETLIDSLGDEAYIAFYERCS